MTQYKQLAQEERYLISALLKMGFSQRGIAARLGRAPSTVSREIRRNATKYDGAYRHCRAQEYTNGRRRRCRRGSKFTPEQYAVVRRYLRKKWSPKQIVGTLGPLGLLEMSHQSIYRYVAQDRKAGGSLWKHLRLKMKLRRKRYGRHDWTVFYAARSTSRSARLGWSGATRSVTGKVTQWWARICATVS